MIWAIIPAWLKRGVAWLLAGFAAFWAIWFAAKREQRAETALEAAERYAKTREKMDEVDTGNDDPAVLREWLRERGKQ